MGLGLSGPAAAQETEEEPSPSSNNSARVLVVQWRGSSADYSNEALQRNIKSRIGRAGAQFFPETDLYQAGRRETADGIEPSAQRGSVPNDVLPDIKKVVNRIISKPYNAYNEDQWADKAQQLLSLVEQIWFVDRAALREPLFRLYAAIGYAAENTNRSSPPFYSQISGLAVNYYWYLAATLAYQDPSLLSKVSASDIRLAIESLRDDIETGRIEKLKLSFDDREGQFNQTAFADEFELYINGLLVEIDNPEGVVEVPLGRVDLHLIRPDNGYALSERLETDRPTEKQTFVLQNAWNSLDLQDQLLKFPNECNPPIPDNILSDLNIYAMLHPDDDIYLAVPDNGETAADRIIIWRWDRISRQLSLVHNNGAKFPVHFVVIGSTGVASSTYSNDPVAFPLPGENRLQVLDKVLPDLSLALEGVPFSGQLRLHYERLMVGVGAQIMIGENGAGSFVDTYTLDPGVEAFNNNAEIALQRRAFQNQVYGLLGVVLGPNARLGRGPRGYIRAGWGNVPNAAHITGHVGLTTSLKELKSPRIHLVADVDAYGGAIVPVLGSLYQGLAFFSMGLTGGIGLTF